VLVVVVVVNFVYTNCAATDQHTMLYHTMMMMMMNIIEPMETGKFNKK